MGRKIALIDGNSLVYRAFFALPISIKTSTGQVTNAVYGFTSMLIRLIQEDKPDAILVAFDKAVPTFREELFAEYKAHRPSMPNELKAQFPLVKEVLNAFGIPILEIEGFEADDIIATISKQAEQKGNLVEIVTADRDALQLVSDKVKVISTRKGVTEVKVYDVKKVLERFGVSPEKIADVLGLMGEPSDNIPGIPGIGEKTALKLIQEYGSLENLLENIESIKSDKLKELLKIYSQQARLSKELATLRVDVPLKINFSQLKLRPNPKAIKETFLSLEFNTLLKRINFEGETIPPKIIEISPKIERVESEKRLEEILIRLEKEGKFGLLIETSGEFLTGEISKVYLSFSKNSVIYFSLDGFQKTFFLPYLKNLLESPQIMKIIYDLKALLPYFRREKINLSEPVFDILIATYLLSPTLGKYNLSDAVKRYLRASLGGKKKVEENSQKVLALLKLYPILNQKIEEEELKNLFFEIEMPLARILSKMEEVGIKIDPKILNNLSKEMERLLEKTEEEIYSLVGEEFNLNSPQQLSKVLFEKLGLKSKKRTKRHLATDFSVLIKLVNEHPVIEKILQHRELFKLKSTYVDVLPNLINPQTSRVHTTFNQTGTATGRLSSNNPNLQNIPIRGEFGQRIREAFVAEPGWLFLSADYSQIDLRILAHLAQDETLCQFFRKGKDIHEMTACEIFGVREENVTPEMRRAAKAVNFGILYGISAFGLAEQLNISKEEAQRYIEKYLSRYPKIRNFIERSISDAFRTGYVKTILGRRRYLPELKSDNIKIRNLGERLAVNTPVQGSSADIIKLAMVQIGKEIEEKNLRTRLLLQIHDELIFEVPKEERDEVERLVRGKMERAYPLSCGLKVEISLGPNWAEVK